MSNHADQTTKPTIAELEAILNDPTPHDIQIKPDGSIHAIKRPVVHSLEAISEAETTGAESVCHEEQLDVWASELTDALSMGYLLSDGLSYDEVIDLAATL